MIAILAQAAEQEAKFQDAMGAIRHAFTDGPSRQDSTVLIVATLVVIAAVVFALLRMRRRESVSEQRPADYLTMAVDLLDLSEQERRDLHALATASGTPASASILLSPANLEAAITEAAPAEAERDARVRALGKRLFAKAP